MAKSRKRRKSKPLKKETPVGGAKQRGYLPLFLKNVGVLLFFILILYSLRNFNKGYRWVFDDLLKNSYVLVKKFNGTTTEERLEAKLGFSYSFLHYLKTNPPGDAIIIIPPKSAFFKKNNNPQFSSEIADYKWSSYFVYPRKLVYEGKFKNTRLYRNATHRAIVNYYCYEFLHFFVPNKQRFAVIPVKLK